MHNLQTNFTFPDWGPLFSWKAMPWSSDHGEAGEPIAAWYEADVYATVRYTFRTGSWGGGPYGRLCGDHFVGRFTSDDLGYTEIVSRLDAFLDGL